MRSYPRGENLLYSLLETTLNKQCRGILDYSAFVNQAASPSPDRTYAVRLPAKSIAVDPSFITYLPNNGTLVVTFVVHPVPWTVVLQAARRESCTRVSLWGKAGNDWGHGCHEIVDEASYPSVALYDAGAGVAPVEWVANAKSVPCPAFWWTS